MSSSDRPAESGRRRWCAALAAGAAAVLVGGCGFRLRGERSLPFDTIFLGFGPNSPLGAELTRSIIAGTRTRVVTDRASAQAVLEVLGESREREVLSVNSQGRTREYQLRLVFTFRVHNGKDHEFVPMTRLQLQRDIAFNEAQVLAREAEETLIYRDMQSDLVQQVLRRLSAARPVGAS